MPGRAEPWVSVEVLGNRALVLVPDGSQFDKLILNTPGVVALPGIGLIDKLGDAVDAGERRALVNLLLDAGYTAQEVSTKLGAEDGAEASLGDLLLAIASKWQPPTYDWEVGDWVFGQRGTRTPPASVPGFARGGAFPNDSPTRLLTDWDGVDGTMPPGILPFGSIWTLFGEDAVIDTNVGVARTGASGASHWGGLATSEDIEAYVDVGNDPIGPGEWIGIQYRLNEISLTPDGYGLNPEKVAAGTDVWTMDRIDNGAFTGLGASFNQEYIEDDGLGVAVAGDQHTAYYRSGLGGSWTSLATRTDATYDNLGYVGCNVDALGEIAAFHAGPVADMTVPFHVGSGTTPTGTGTGTGTTSCAPNYPATLQEGDAILMAVWIKPETATAPTITSWTKVSNGEAAGGGGTTGADTGPTRLCWYYYNPDADDTGVGSTPPSGTLTVTPGSSPNCCMAQMYLVRGVGPDNVWDIDGAQGIDTTTGATFTATMNVNPGITAGDVVFVAGSIPTDVTTPAQFSAETLTATGLTSGAVTEFAEPETTQGNDLGGVVCRWTPTGTASTAATFTATAGGTTTNVRGPICLVRVRVTAAASDILYAGGQASATHTALAGTGHKMYEGAQASATHSALAGLALKLYAGGQASSTNTALAGTAIKNITVVGGIASETDTGLAGTGRKTYEGTQPSSTNVALAGAALKLYAGGLASSTNTALAGITIKPITVTGGIASVTHTGLAGVVTKLYGGTIVSVTHTALPGTGSKVYFGGTRHMYVGALVDGEAYGGSFTDPPWDITSFEEFESNAGKGQSILHYGQFWYESGVPVPFHETPADNARNHGSIPLIDWNPWDNADTADVAEEFTLADIIAGNHDTTITDWFEGAAAWGHPFFVRIMHEANGTWFPWGISVHGNTAGEHITAWRHIHDLAQAAGATNATFVWCPLATYVGQPAAIDDLYPGDDYVDWLALDGYNFGGTSFDTIFGDSFDELWTVASADKPVMLAEWATDDDGDEVAWIADAFDEIRNNPRYEAIHAVVWFNWDTELPNLWRIESNPGKEAAYAAAIEHPIFLENEFASLSLPGTIPPPLGPALEFDQALEGVLHSGGDIIVVGGTATEIDSAMAGVGLKRYVQGTIVSSTNTALNGTPARVYVQTGIPSVTHTALPGTAQKNHTYVGGIALETDVALPGLVQVAVGLFNPAGNPTYRVIRRSRYRRHY